MDGRRKSAKPGQGGAFVYSDSSLLEKGNIGGGAFVVARDRLEKEVDCGVRDIATV